MSKTSSGLGTRTLKFESMLNLYQNVMGMNLTHQEPALLSWIWPNGDKVELFGEPSEYNRDFTIPCRFSVDDIDAARAEMGSAAGTRVLRSDREGEMDTPGPHFARPTVFLYELSYRRAPTCCGVASGSCTGVQIGP